MTHNELMTNVRSAAIVIAILAIIIVPIIINKVKKNKEARLEKEEQEKKQKAEEERLKRVEKIKQETAVFYSTQSRFVTESPKDESTKEEVVPEEKNEEQETLPQEEVEYKNAVYITQEYSFTTRVRKGTKELDLYNTTLKETNEKLYVQEIKPVYFLDFYLQSLKFVHYIVKPDLLNMTIGSTNESNAENILKSILDTKHTLHEHNSKEAQYYCYKMLGENTTLITNANHKELYLIKYSKERPPEKLKYMSKLITCSNFKGKYVDLFGRNIYMT